MRRWLPATFCALTVACIHTSVTPVTPVARAARSPDSVALLLEAPEQPYTVVATVRSTGETVFDGFGDLREALRAEAAKLGGDAVILEPGHTDSEFIFTGTAMIRSDRKKLSGVVIVYEREG